LTSSLQVPMPGLGGHRGETLRFHKSREYLDQLNVYKLFKTALNGVIQSVCLKKSFSSPFYFSYQYHHYSLSLKLTKLLEKYQKQTFLKSIQ